MLEPVSATALSAPPSSITPAGYRAGLVGVLLTLAVCYAIPSVFGMQVGTTTIVVHLLLTAWMLYFWRFGRTDPTPAELSQLLRLGVLARLIVLAVPAFTTHDVQRYLWDGAVALQGLDPYLTAPDNPIVADLRKIWPTPAEHAAYPTLYPPLALAIYSLCALAGPEWGIWLWKLVVTAASIATLFVVSDLLRRLGQQRHTALIALSPLMLLEVGIGAHVDALSALALSGALWAGVRGLWLAVGIAIGIGACVKLLPFAALGPILLATHLSRWLKIISGALATVAVVYGGAVLLGLRPIGNLGVFFDKWRNGSPINTALEWGFPDLSHTLFVVPAALLLGCFALYRARKDLHAGLFIMLATPLLLSPVVFSWYLLVLVPLVAIRPSAFGLIWLTTVPFAYEVLNLFETTGEWLPAVWPLWLIAVGWLIGALLDRFYLSDGPTANRLYLDKAIKVPSLR